MTNAAASPVFYRPDDRDMLAALKDMDENGLDVASIFHSHVATRATRRPTDIRRAHYPDAVFVIVSFETGTIRTPGIPHPQAGLATPPARRRGGAGRGVVGSRESSNARMVGTCHRGTDHGQNQY